MNNTKLLQLKNKLKIDKTTMQLSENLLKIKILCSLKTKLKNIQQ